MKKGAGEGWSCRFWLKACELFVYLKLRFRSYQFEEQVLSSQTFIMSLIIKGPWNIILRFSTPSPPVYFSNFNKNIHLVLDPHNNLGLTYNVLPFLV